MLSFRSISSGNSNIFTIYRIDLSIRFVLLYYESIIRPMNRSNNAAQASHNLTYSIHETY